VKRAGRTTTDLLREGARRLAASSVDSPRLTAELILSHCLSVDRARLYLEHGEIPPSRVRQFCALVRKRASGIPLQYLTGTADFLGLRLAVTPRVFIPRPETEFLVAEASRIVQERFNGRPVRMLDIATGSGAVAVALAAMHPEAQVTATDISAAAVRCCRRNAAQTGVADRVRCVRCDLFRKFPGGRFSIIVSNPPYVPSADMPGLPVEVKHEPARALDGGPDGLAAIRAILFRAASHLAEGGAVLVEIGDGQASLLRKETFPGLMLDRFAKDAAGIERVAVFSSSRIKAPPQS